MKYRICAKSAHRIRIRLYVSRLSNEQADILRDVFSETSGVTGVTIYQATCGLALEFACPEEEIIRKLNAFRFENVVMMAGKISPYISADEMRERKLDPHLKNKLRMRILAESIFDIATPMPIQLGYHVWQMITLREF